MDEEDIDLDLDGDVVQPTQDLYAAVGGGW